MPPPERSVVSPQVATSKPLPRPESASSVCPGVQRESQSVPPPTTLYKRVALRSSQSQMEMGLRRKKPGRRRSRNWPGAVMAEVSPSSFKR